MKEYIIPVNFTTTYQITVEAEDETEARDLAGEQSTKIFREELDKGLLGVSDFVCEPQEPL